VNECPTCGGQLETATTSKGALTAVFCPTCNATWEFIPTARDERPPWPLAPEANLARLQELRNQLAGQET
jgi:hypothetical protein